MPCRKPCAADGEGREKRVELDPCAHDFPLALHAPDRYVRKHAEDLDRPPICERDGAESGCER